MSLGLTEDKSTGLGNELVTSGQQAITWADVDPDLCRHMASLGNDVIYNYLTGSFLLSNYSKMTNYLQEHEMTCNA